MTEFISKISPEKKKIRELRYNLYVHGIQEENLGGWASIILDKHEQKTVLSGKEENLSQPNRIDLIGIIEGLRWIYLSVEPKYRKYIIINLNCDNVYCINIIKDWIDKWKDDIDIRPNNDLLKELLELKSKMNISAKWVNKVSNEYSWSVNRISKERKEEIN
jgi:ribonuclease HI